MNHHSLTIQIQSLKAKLNQLEQMSTQVSDASLIALESSIVSLATQIESNLPTPVNSTLIQPSQELSEEQLQALSVCLPVGIFTTNPDGLCTYISQRAQEIIKGDLEEIVRTDWLGSIYSCDCVQVVAQWLHRTQAGLPNFDEFQVNMLTGEVRWVLVRAAAIYSDGNVFLGHIGTIEDITQQKQVDAQIKASLEEKKALLREVHHRVKNNLQVLSSIIYLQAERIGDTQVRQVLEDSRSRLSSMALVHDSLYRSENFDSIDFSDYIQILTNSLFHAYRIRPELVTLKVQVDSGVIVTIDKAIPCGLILNELVTNALKHGFPGEQQGLVTVKLDRVDDQVCLTVENDGNPLPETFDQKKIKSVGLRLVKALVNQLDGQLAVENTAKTQFKVTFNGS